MAANVAVYWLTLLILTRKVMSSTPRVIKSDPC